MILAAIEVDPILSKLILLSLIIIVVGFVLYLLKQPSVITYIIVGILVGANVLGIIRDESLISNSLHSFKIMFVALFFVSAGMLIDIRFVKNNFSTILSLVLLIFLMNNASNVPVIRLFIEDWKASLYSGALLAQVGEFSFIIGATGFATGIIQEYGYQLIISTIALTLLLSPFWIGLTRHLISKLHRKTTTINTQF